MIIIVSETRETKIQQLNVPGVYVQDAVEELLCMLLVVQSHGDPAPVTFEGLV